MPSKLKMS